MISYSYIHLENRKPVSIRVPAPIAEAVESFAAEQGIRKTDAYLHFIQLGLEAASDNEDSEH